MGNSISSCDWSLIRAFLAVAESGSLSGAARNLGSSQPTLGRQIKQLEETLQQVLFHRQAKGFTLSESGQAILEPAQAMRRAMTDIELTAMGRQTALEGTVRITASEMVAQWHLPQIIADIRAAHPGIMIDVVSSDSSDNLLFREADIAIRMYRPEQLELVVTHLGEVQLGLYGAKGYLDRTGRPETMAEILKHNLIGYDRNEEIIKGMQERGLPASRDWFSVRCDSHPVNWALVRAGCGLGFCHVEIARAYPDVERIDVPLDIPVLPVWLTTHQALRHTPRISVVWDALSEGLRMQFEP